MSKNPQGLNHCHIPHWNWCPLELFQEHLHMVHSLGLFDVGSRSDQSSLVHLSALLCWVPLPFPHTMATGAGEGGACAEVLFTLFCYALIILENGPIRSVSKSWPQLQSRCAQLLCLTSLICFPLQGKELRPSGSTNMHFWGSKHTLIPRVTPISKCCLRLLQDHPLKG